MGFSNLLYPPPYPILSYPILSYPILSYPILLTHLSLPYPETIPSIRALIDSPEMGDGRWLETDSESWYVCISVCYVVGGKGGKIPISSGQPRRYQSSSQTHTHTHMELPSLFRSLPLSLSLSLPLSDSRPLGSLALCFCCSLLFPCFGPYDPTCAVVDCVHTLPTLPYLPM
jgi:hypothetical protein